LERSESQHPPINFNPTGRGAFSIFFDRLACEIAEGHFVAGPNGRTRLPVEIYFFGHSMGALVGNELLVRHPELPLRRIVYMGGATPIRDFRLTVIPLLGCADAPPDRATVRSADRASPPETAATNPACELNVHFYNLMLHPLDESHEMHFGGAAPEGSLLEWIDEMFGKEKSLDDRMLGKWTNVEQSLRLFPVAARSRMVFRVFPAQEKMSNGDAQEAEVFAKECAVYPAGSPTPPRCHPIQHGEFASYSFWREGYLCGYFGCPDPDPPFPATAPPGGHSGRPD
jgi:hypothetical protein